MFPTRRHVSAVPELLRLSACLIHAMPHCTALLATGAGDRHVVAHHRTDATLTPCQLRVALLEPIEPGVPHLAQAIESLEIVGGAIDLGGGVYQLGHLSGPEQRWFATTLRSAEIEAIADRCPDDVDHSDISVRVIADVDLDVSAVCLSGDGIGVRLDAVACWLHTQCLVEELLLARS